MRRVSHGTWSSLLCLDWLDSPISGSLSLGLQGCVTQHLGFSYGCWECNSDSHAYVARTLLPKSSLQPKFLMFSGRIQGYEGEALPFHFWKIHEHSMEWHGSLPRSNPCVCRGPICLIPRVTNCNSASTAFLGSDFPCVSP